MDIHLKKTLFVASRGRTVRLSVKSYDIISSKISKGTNSFNKRSYYMGKISKEDCEARLMKYEKEAFFIRKIDEVGYCSR